MRWMLHWKGGNSIITMEKFSKTIFINVGKNIVTRNFYFIKKKSSGIEKKNVILIWLQSVQKLMYPTWIIQ